MKIDFHTHIFPGKIRDNRKKYFHGEPEFTLLYDSPKSKISGAAEIVETMNEQGVDFSVTFGFPWKNPKVYKMHNDYIMEAVERYPGRLAGFGCFDVMDDGAGQEAERCIEGGLAGIGELAFYGSGIDRESIERLEPVMEICLKKNLPVLIHTNEPVGHKYPGKTSNTLNQIYSMVRRYPENIIVLAHWGGGIFFFSTLKKEVKESLKNVYFDTAASPFLYDTDIYKYAKKLAGIDKILFGSDFPLIKPARYFKELDNTGLSKNDIDKICGLNAERLLKQAVQPKL